VSVTQKHAIQIVCGYFHYCSLFGSKYSRYVQHVKFLCWVGLYANFLKVFGQVLPNAWLCSSGMTLSHKIIIVPEDSLLFLWHYNSERLLAFSTVSSHLRQSRTCSAHFTSFIFFKSFLTSSSHLDLGLPAGLPVNGFHLCSLFTMLVSGILFVCRNQLNRWALT